MVPDSLTGRLFLSFAALVAVTLGIAGTVFVVSQHAREREAAIDRLSAAAPSIALQLRALDLFVDDSSQVAAFTREAASDWGVRILIVDEGRSIVADSDDSLVQQTLAIPDRDETLRRGFYLYWTSDAPGQQGLVFLTGLPHGPGGLRAGRGVSDETVVLAVPESTLAGAWYSLLSHLLVPGGLALAAGAAGSLLLSRSIARPIAALKDAAHAASRGDFGRTPKPAGPRETRELTEAFDAMVKEVARSQRQMRTLVGSASHDLRTPLTSVLGYAQALRDGTVQGDERVRQAGGVIHAEAERMRSLVTDLLYLSQIDSREVRMERLPVDLGEVCREAAARAEARPPGRAIRIDLDDSTPVRALGDPMAAGRVVDELFVNAVKYADAGTTVTAELVRFGAEVRLVVASRGPVLAPEQVERLFDRFYRANPADRNGTGLGLAIARELAELMGGSISASSDSGLTTIELRLLAEATGTD